MTSNSALHYRSCRLQLHFWAIDATCMKCASTPKLFAFRRVLCVTRHSFKMCFPALISLPPPSCAVPYLWGHFRRDCDIHSRFNCGISHKQNDSELQSTERSRFTNPGIVGSGWYSNLFEFSPLEKERSVDIILDPVRTPLCLRFNAMWRIEDGISGLFQES